MEPSQGRCVRRWLYQAQLLAAMASEHEALSMAQQQSLRDAAMAMVARALQGFVVELTAVPPVEVPAWPEVLTLLPEGCAERQRLKRALLDPEGELHVLHTACSAWQSGAPVPPFASDTMIASTSTRLTLSDALEGLKKLMDTLRESAQQW